MTDEVTTPETAPETKPETTEQSLLTENAPKAEEAPKDGGAPKEESPKEEAPAPLTADAIKLPEGLEVPDGVMDKFVGLMNNSELSGAERAQALIDLQAEVAKEASEKGSQLWATQQEQWVNEIKSDPTVGQGNLQRTLDNAGKVLDKYGTPELRDLLATTGAGNSIHVARFFNAIAKEISEGAPVQGQPAQAEQSLADRMYPTMKR